MPANLPPQYFEVEKNFRQAKTTPEKIAILEEMLAIMPKHKGTDHLRAELRRRIAKLTQALGKKTATHRLSMTLEKEGAAQVAIIGLPNSGKSQLVDSITNASPTVAEYPFTTNNITLGMMEFENIKIQLIDTPPLVPQPAEFWIPPIFRRADALMVILDLSNAPIDQMEVIIAQLNNMKIQTGIKKILILGNKIDLPKANQNYKVIQKKYEKQFPVIAISARERIGLEELKLKLYQVLDIIRVYTKAPGEKADFNDPIILKRGSTMEDAATSVHKDFHTKMKYARVWGSGKHSGLMVKRDHILQDGDIIELHL
jgi:small GTP-binding protein